MPSLYAMRGLVLAAVLSLSGCAYAPVGSFTPQSHSVPGNQICSDAIELGPGDLGAIRKAGGILLGKLELSLDDGWPNKEAAAYGGTHYLRRSSAVSYTQHGVVASRHEDAVFDIYRVGRAGWGQLPAGLRPAE